MTCPARLPVALTFILFFLASPVIAQELELVTVATDGSQANNSTLVGDLSSDGRLVTFASWASNLVPGDTNGLPDVFLRDRRLGTTKRVNVSPSGAQANGYSIRTSISGDGRLIVFDSAATNLLAEDQSSYDDVYLVDTWTGTLMLVSKSSTGLQSDKASWNASVSKQGQHIAFFSFGTNLVPGDTNQVGDIFVREWQSHVTTRVSVSSAGVEANGYSYLASLSADGRYVAFISAASNLVAGDTNKQVDGFVHDRASQTTWRISVGPGGEQGQGECYDVCLSLDGRLVAFSSDAPNLLPPDRRGTRDAFLHDLQSGGLRRISARSGGRLGDGQAWGVFTEGRGSQAFFTSDSSNLCVGDSNGVADAFVHDSHWDETQRIAMGLQGIQGNGRSVALASADGGRIVLLSSLASNLVPGDNNGKDDLFVLLRAEWCRPAVSPYCTAKTSVLGCMLRIGFAGCPSASASDGFFVTAADVPNQASGLLLYGFTGRAALPFQYGYLCVAPPVHRAPVVTSSGSTPPLQNCTGNYSIDMNAFASGSLGGSPAPALAVSGTVVWCQWLGRGEPGLPQPFERTLSNALEFVIGP